MKNGRLSNQISAGEETRIFADKFTTNNMFCLTLYVKVPQDRTLVATDITEILVVTDT
jgi:hypothetical protein